MNKQIRWVVAALTCGLASIPLRAEVIQSAGILGNSGEQGKSLVRFNGSKPAIGLGVVVDRYGAFWDRAGSGVLNRYAADGRLLATYRIPGERPAVNAYGDAIAAVGDKLMLCVDQGLHILAVDAPAGSATTALKIPATQISLSSHDGWVAAANGMEVFLVNAAGEKKPVATLQKAPNGLEVGPDGAVYIIIEGKAYRPAADAPNGLALVGPVPGDRTQFLNGFLYGANGHSTLRRFDTQWQPAPGVVMGGNSGSFIGHVDEQAEVVSPRGMAKAGPDLFAVSGRSGILHLLEWEAKDKRFDPFRRIGSIPSCAALALDRQGRTWWLSGNWNWNDGPATPLHFGIPEPEILALTMTDSDGVVGYGSMWGKPSVLFGKMGKEVRHGRIDTPTTLPKEGAVAVAVSEQNKRPVLLVLQKKGGVTAVNISDTGEYRSDIGPVQFVTATPVAEWTSLVTTGNNTLVAAGDGSVIELARDGANWKETRRWNSWGTGAAQKFGGPVWVSADAGKLWVSDSTRHRVVCFELASGRELAAYGTADVAGDDLARLDTPRVIAARGTRAVVSDSGNQRLVKLEIK